MSSKVAIVFTAYCLFYCFNEIESSFIKPKHNVPRIGRSNEEIIPFDQGSMGYVIKTNKNIPRLGRRNYDSENRFDIPKLYQLPAENLDVYGDDGESYNQDPIEAYYGKRLENMKR